MVADVCSLFLVPLKHFGGKRKPGPAQIVIKFHFAILSFFHLFCSVRLYFAQSTSSSGHNAISYIAKCGAAIIQRPPQHCMGANGTIVLKIKFAKNKTNNRAKSDLYDRRTTSRRSIHIHFIQRNNDGDDDDDDDRNGSIGHIQRHFA